MRRVVITGLGPVAPNGVGKDAFWKALMEGRSGIREITGFDASAFPCRIAGQVSDFDAAAYMDPRRARRMARFAQFAVAAATLAVRDAGLDLSTGLAQRGVCLGVSSNAVDYLGDEIESFVKRGSRRTSPVVAAAAFPHAAAAEVSVECACQGPTSTISAGCASGAAAVGQACEEIRARRAEVMLAGGSDSPVNLFTLAGMSAARLLPPEGENDDPERASRPFDATRKGGIIAEGAGILVLESLEHALARRARIYAEVLAHASNAEAHGMIEFAGDDTFLQRSMRMALDASGLRTTDVDYISAHGPGDGCDMQETRAIKAVFGKHAYNLAVSSIKSMIGNPFAAAGPLQLIATSMALCEQRVPPTINYSVADPQCDLDYVPNRARVCRVNVALVNSHGFGGANHCMVVGRCPRSGTAAPHSSAARS